MDQSETALKPLPYWCVIQKESPYYEELFFNKDSALAFYNKYGSKYDLKSGFISHGYYQIEWLGKRRVVYGHISGLYLAGSTKAGSDDTQSTLYYTTSENLAGLRERIDSWNRSKRACINPTYISGALSSILTQLAI